MPLSPPHGDLTSYHEAESALREREARVRSILETVPGAIVTIDEEGIIESFSASATRLFGYEPEEAIGQNVKILMPFPYHGTGSVVVGRRHDGTTFPMELLIGEAWIGERRLFTAYVRDITEHQVAQQRLQELQSELLHVSRLSAMGQMASTLAHELNQPLSAIANYVKASHRMLDAIDDPRKGRIQETMTKASEQTIRAGEIIRRLRDYVEKRQTTRTWENLNKVVEEALALGLIGAAETNVKVRATLDPALPPVAIDKVQIQQVLINLIRNAIEAMRAAPTRVLSITTRLDEGEFVQVGIADTGPGLAEEVAARLFQPFVTTKKAGMGVGLTICQSIIEGHGGRIWATANETGGVTFWFRLSTRKPNEPG